MKITLIIHTIFQFHTPVSPSLHPHSLYQTTSDQDSSQVPTSFTYILKKKKKQLTRHTQYNIII